MIVSITYNSGGFVKKLILSVLAASVLFASQAHAFWRVSWTDNSDNEDSFRIERSIAGAPYEQVGTVSMDTTTFDDTASTAGVQYCFRVIAVNGIGEAASPERCGMAAAPAAPGTPELQWIP